MSDQPGTLAFTRNGTSVCVQLAGSEGVFKARINPGTGVMTSAECVRLFGEAVAPAGGETVPALVDTGSVPPLSWYELTGSAQLASQPPNGQNDVEVGYSIGGFECSLDNCVWSAYTQATHWDYYSSVASDCESCVTACTADPGCWAVECGGTYCSWWANGSCGLEDSSHEGTGPVVTCRHGDTEDDTDTAGDHVLVMTTSAEFDQSGEAYTSLAAHDLSAGFQLRFQMYLLRGKILPSRPFNLPLRLGPLCDRLDPRIGTLVMAQAVVEMASAH